MQLLHFTAEWCGPCKMMKPMIEKVLEEHPEIEYIPVDIDANKETAINYEIMGVPTFILIGDDNEQRVRFSGGMMKQQFIDALGI